MIAHIAPKTLETMSLDHYLRRAYPMLSAQILRTLLKKRDVRVNGVRSDAHALVRGGDAIAVYLDDARLLPGAQVLFDDGRLLVLDKPAGLPVDVDALGIGEDTLLRRAQRLHPAARLCHRLDAGTGGVVLFALDDPLYADALLAFHDHIVEKRYQTVVVGRPAEPAGVLQGYLRKDAQAARVSLLSAPAPGAKVAKTLYSVHTSGYANRAELSLLDIQIPTGRTHQIRAQLSRAGLPILGDDKYGDRAANKRYGASTPFLWCVFLRLPFSGYEAHPFTSQPSFPDLKTDDTGA